MSTSPDTKVFGLNTILLLWLLYFTWMVIKSLGFKSIETLSLALNKCGDDVVTVIMFLSTDPLRTLLKFVLKLWVVPAPTPVK